MGITTVSVGSGVTQVPVSSSVSTLVVNTNSSNVINLYATLSASGAPVLVQPGGSVTWPSNEPCYATNPSYNTAGDITLNVIPGGTHYSPGNTVTTRLTAQQGIGTTGMGLDVQFDNIQVTSSQWVYKIGQAGDTVYGPISAVMHNMYITVMEGTIDSKSQVICPAFYGYVLFRQLNENLDNAFYFSQNDGNTAYVDFADTVCNIPFGYNSVPVDTPGNFGLVGLNLTVYFPTSPPSVVQLYSTVSYTVLL